MPVAKDRRGEKIGRLTIIEFSHRNTKNSYWLCECECGNRKVLCSSNLANGTYSCGCLRSETVRARETTHGLSYHPLFVTWRNMVERCTKDSCRIWKYYGGRGIKVCDRWLDPHKFMEDMYPSWKPGLELDRTNNDGNYEPSNCRWVTRQENCCNRRNNILVDTQWGKILLSEASQHTGIKYGTLTRRYREGVRGDQLFRPAVVGRNQHSKE